MNGWTLSRRAFAVAALTATAALGASTTATADQPKTPAELGIDQLTQAAGDNVAAKTAVADIAQASHLVTAAKLENVLFTPFAYQAPTLGCGFNMPFSLTQAMAVTGIATQNGTVSLPGGVVSFQVMAQQNGFPLASGLSVAWLNVNNGRSGLAPLDDQTEYNLPALSKSADTGPGTVIASLWGTIDYPQARCVVLPTVGLFTVSDIPPAQSPAPDPAAPGTSTTPTTPVAPSTPAQAPDAAAPTPAQAPDAGSGAPAN
ncbi:hypothetical protein D7D52_00885 [Nocardia yunnanensis]|uniref:Secreted protein n=1 Tax=Nocardia yunnanensis TaxID=2382165 RepID=A0A386Z4G0_9NOCA|nr:hypothetical protein [Nocardia yunnanensis]AYF72672.1 hypothetical protein D7D52_00885 [Nocardia yunnanensis]